MVDTIEESREHIQTGSSDNVDTAYLALTQSFTESNDYFNQQEVKMTKFKDRLLSPLQGQTLKWISENGKQSGETVLAYRMKSLQKIVKAEEDRLAQKIHEWLRVQGEISNVVVEVQYTTCQVADSRS